jgi:hypothetical protein
MLVLFRTQSIAGQNQQNLPKIRLSSDSKWNFAIGIFATTIVTFSIKNYGMETGLVILSNKAAFPVF